jgi:DNA polymerase
MHAVDLAHELDVEGWRTAARRLRLAEVPPDRVVWRIGDAAGLFDGPPPPAAPAQGGFGVPKGFAELAGDVIHHRSEDRFDLIYRLLWRLKAWPRLLEVLTDPDVARAFRMQKEVAHAVHKMHAFVRFRRVEAAGPRETYVAWFEPPHRVIDLGVPFFVRRMANLDFSVLSPDLCAHWNGTDLSFTPGMERPAGPDDDGLEEAWRTYFASVFNPARLNPKAMIQHMPRHYWRNLPEAALIPELVGQASARTTAMVHAAPRTPSARAMRAAARAARGEPVDTGIAPAALEDVAAGVHLCRRCDLWRDATQGVPGEGPRRAKLMLVGEQPGDQEDLAGRAFVGPAGALLDKALAAAGAPRAEIYVTNAVKHFKHELRGKRRLHKTPNAGEVQACRWWLDNERRLVRPRVIVALGGTAASAVFRRPVSVMRERGPAGALEHGARGFVTVHPSYLLHLPDPAAKAREFDAFVRDLADAWALAAA